ncbi:kinase-like domain-containing protein [Amylostereum chailletii]|nr:kinase-like domain-containing protein [Amylostereum chailletii]
MSAVPASHAPLVLALNDSDPPTSTESSPDPSPAPTSLFLLPSSSSSAYSLDSLSHHVPKSPFPAPQLQPTSPKPSAAPPSAPLPTAGRRISLADFDILKLLGTGNLGEVYLARDRATNVRVALKVVSKDIMAALHFADDDMLMEQRVMRGLESMPGALRLLASWHDSAHWYLATECIDNGDLRSQIQKDLLSPAHVRFFVAQILLLLEDLHARAVLHRDVKPENILIDRAGHAVLADFGISRQFADGAAPLASEVVGTLSYMSPEMVAHAAYSYEADYWALGITAFQMLTGEVPFDGPECKPHVAASAILADEVKFRDCHHVDAVAQDFVRKVLAKNPADRPSVAAMKAHPFFAGIDWPALAARTAPSPFVAKPPAPLPTGRGLVVPSGKPYAPSADPHPSFTYVSAPLNRTVVSAPPAAPLVTRPAAARAAPPPPPNSKPKPKSGGVRALFGGSGKTVPTAPRNANLVKDGKATACAPPRNKFRNKVKGVFGHAGRK